MVEAKTTLQLLIYWRTSFCVRVSGNEAGLSLESHTRAGASDRCAKCGAHMHNCSSSGSLKSVPKKHVEITANYHMTPNRTLSSPAKV